LALRAGFRAIDTANQRRHYFEEAVGDAVHAVLADGEVTRADLFLQTKFTYSWSQDMRLPYDIGASPAAQVTQSVESSLTHLRTSYLDSYLLHSPSSPGRLTDEDWQVWNAMLGLQRAGVIGLVGISNVSLAQLEMFPSELRPAIVQNPYRLQDRGQREVLEFCRTNGIAYQGFGILTANKSRLASPAVLRIAQRSGRTPAEVLIHLARRRGVIPVTGPSDPAHMRDALACGEFCLSEQDVECLDGTQGST
jgi:diketogulonate reductase-like aldo/keto reductase